MIIQCEFCKHFHDPGFTPGIGQCRRNPPVNGINSEEGDDEPTPSIETERWPSVFADDWCGEFSPNLKRGTTYEQQVYENL